VARQSNFYPIGRLFAKELFCKPTSETFTLNRISSLAAAVDPSNSKQHDAANPLTKARAERLFM